MSKKRKRKLSSSSEEDEQESVRKDVYENHESSKTKHDANSPKRTVKQENSAIPTVKDGSQSSRRIKKPLYRLSKTQAADQKHDNKDEEWTKPGSVIVPLHCDNSRKDNSISGRKTMERRHSKHSHREGTVHQRTEKTSKDRLHEKSSCSRSPKSERKRADPSLVSADQKEQRQDGLKKKRRRAEEAPRTRNDSNSSKTRQPSRTSSSSSSSSILYKDSSWRKRTELASSSKAVTNVTAVKSKVAKNMISISGNITSVSHATTMSSSAQKQVQPLNFKIPKKVQPKPGDRPGENNGAYSTSRNLKHGTKLSDCGALVSNSKQETVQQAHSSLDVTSSFTPEGQAETPSSSSHPQAVFRSVTEPWCDQMQVGEELHLDGTEKRLEPNIMASYGKPTGMDIDPPEEGAAGTHCIQPPQQYLLVLDTNILISHLDRVKTFLSHGLGDDLLCEEVTHFLSLLPVRLETRNHALGSPAVLIPWVVLQELDSLKDKSGTYKAVHAISYINTSLKNREPHLWCQSMQQAVESHNGLYPENNDDEVLLCCLQYQRLYPEHALILCTNDKNLCNKAIVSGVTAHSMKDLEAEAGRASRDLHTGMLPHITPHVSSTLPTRIYEKDTKQLSRREEEERTMWDISCVSELENCLRVVLADLLKDEMNSAFGDLWPEIVSRKPPWTLQDILHCIKKHWIAVFGHVVPRRMLQTVLNLIKFFCSGTTPDCSSTSVALQQAKELLNAFRKRSSLVPRGLSVLEGIHNKLQMQRYYPDCDVVMNVNDEVKHPTLAEVSHQEVWAVFESIWSYVSQKSLEVFKALGFDPRTMQSVQPVGGPPPPQDALVCLHRLSSIVSQLLQAFSSVLSSASGLKEAQVLLDIIQSNKIIDVDSRLTAKHLHDCFSQQDYREKLRTGGNQLMEVKEALDGCMGTTGHMTFTTSLP